MRRRVRRVRRGRCRRTVRRTARGRCGSPVSAFVRVASVNALPQGQSKHVGEDRSVTGLRQLPALGLAAVGGIALAVQSRLNGGLGASLQDGIAASMISNGTGILVLLL